MSRIKGRVLALGHVIAWFFLVVNPVAAALVEVVTHVGSGD